MFGVRCFLPLQLLLLPSSYIVIFPALALLYTYFLDLTTPLPLSLLYSHNPPFPPHIKNQMYFITIKLWLVGYVITKVFAFIQFGSVCLVYI